MNLPSSPHPSPPPPSFCSRLYLSIMSYYNSLLPKQNGNPAPLWMPSLRGLYGCPPPSPLLSSLPPPLKHRIWWRLYDFEVGGGLWPANRGTEISPIHPRTGLLRIRNSIYNDCYERKLSRFLALIERIDSYLSF